MGTADAVPGVSGGTVALIVGIYDRLVAAISAISLSTLRTVVGAVRQPRALFAEGPIRDAIKRMDLPFLITLVAGIFTAVLILTRIVTVVDATNPVPMFALFFGLIGASGIALTRELRPISRAEAVAFVGGIVVAFLASGFAGTTIGRSLPLLFVVGMIAVSAMVLPGLSGSLLLLIFGQYTYLSRTLSEFIDALVAMDNAAVLVDRGTVVVTFIAGGVVGVLTVSRIVNWALTRNRPVTIALLVGLVLGALRAPLREINAAADGWTTLSAAGVSIDVWTAEVALVVAAWTVAGVLFITVIDRYLYRIRV